MQTGKEKRTIGPFTSMSALVRKKRRPIKKIMNKVKKNVSKPLLK